MSSDTFDPNAETGTGEAPGTDNGIPPGPAPTDAEATLRDVVNAIDKLTTAVYYYAQLPRN